METVDYGLPVEIIYAEFDSVAYDPHTGNLWFSVSEDSRDRLIELSGERKIPCVLHPNGEILISSQLLRKFDPPLPWLPKAEADARRRIITEELN